jgi:RNA polymerase sigma-70 factor (ECF subfamily)
MSSCADRPPARCPVPRALPSTDLALALVKLYPELRARAQRLTGESAAAEDLVQDTIERALRFAPTFALGTQPRAWAMQILFSVFVTRWRRRRRERRALESLGADPYAWTQPARFAPPDAGDGAILPSAQRTFDALPEHFRAVLVLVDLERRTYREAARELGVPVGTVMSRVHRGRKLLGAELAVVPQAA